MRGSPPCRRCLFRWATSALRSSASTTIVRNLKIRKVSLAAPIRTWRKNTGPGESSLIRNAITDEERAQHEPTPAIETRDVERPLQQTATTARAAAAAGRRAAALDRVDADPGPDELEETRNDVDLDVESFIERIRSRVSSCDSFENAMITRSMSNRRTTAGSSIGRPEESQMLEVVAPLLRLGVDESRRG